MSSWPLLRTDLGFYDGGSDFTGAPTWLIHDPLNNQFYQIGYREYQILSQWSLGDAEKIIHAVNAQTTLKISKKHLTEVTNFMSQHCLSQQSDETLAKRNKQIKQQKQSPLNLLMEKALFCRFHLWNPDAFLDKTIKYVGWIFHRYTVIAMIILALFALMLLSRQWEMFTHTFVDTFSTSGLILFVISYLFSKFCHEFGHAYQCKLNKLRVPSMGFGLFVMMPIMYTDTIESWTIKDKYRRMKVGLGGVWIELYLAVIASFLWLMLPDGLLRSAMFYLAWVNWLLTLFINMSPFMRLDGYHILADFLGIRNLQTRAFLVARWWLRKFLFGIKQPIPEPLNKNQRFWFVSYAFACWAYRFFIFLFIATIIYDFAFKLLGILLIIAEIYYFIFRPIFKELKHWWSIRRQVNASSRALITSGVILILIILCFIPLRSTIDVPATLSYQHQRLYLPYGARVEAIKVKPGQVVSKGESLFDFHSSYIHFQSSLATLKYNSALWQFKHATFNSKERENQAVYQQEWEKAKSQLQGWKFKQARLDLKAPFNGKVVDVDPALRTGEWVKKGQNLVTVINPNITELEAFVDAHELKKLKKGEVATFYPDNLEKHAMKAVVTDIDLQQTKSLSNIDKKSATGLLVDRAVVDTPAFHASNYGGEIPVRQSSKHGLVPEYAAYRVQLTGLKPYELDQVERGELHFSIRPKSLAERFWNWAVRSVVKSTAL